MKCSAYQHGDRFVRTHRAPVPVYLTSASVMSLSNIYQGYYVPGALLTTEMNIKMNRIQTLASRSA